jgi:hypothetical protein
LNLQSARLPSFHNGSPENIGGPDEGGVESVTMKLWQQKIWIWFIFGAACGVAVSAATFALITPCVRISPNVLHEFKPGMTLKEVEAIIGGPQGFYDGITGVQSNAPPWKGDWSWVGSEGEVVIYPNNAQRVEKASFYSIRILSQDKGQLVWERLTRGVLRDVNLQTPYAEMLYGAVFTLFLAIPLTVVISTWKGRFNWYVCVFVFRSDSHVHNVCRRTFFVRITAWRRRDRADCLLLGRSFRNCNPEAETRPAVRSN